MDMEPVAPDPGPVASLPERQDAGQPDRHLLERFIAAREEEAFARIVQRHGRVVLHVCRRILGNSHDAEDAFQATFLVLAQRARAIRRHDALASWLCGVATRVALRLKGRLYRLRSAEQWAAALPPPSLFPPPTGADSCADPLDRWPAPPTRAADPAAVAGRADDAAVLARELGQLPDKYRAPLVLCYLEGQTTEAAAARLRCPVGTFKSRLAKARDLLRTRLTRRGVVMASAVLPALLAEGAAAGAVPPSLVRATARATQPAATAVAPQVTALVKETLKAMRTPQLLAGAVAAGCALVALLSVLLANARTPSSPEPAGAEQAVAGSADGRASGTLIVVNQRSATVTLIDVRTGKTRATVRTDLCTTDPCPHEVAVSPRGTTAAVSNYGLPFGAKYGNAIILIDVATGGARTTLDLGKFTAPHGLQWLDEDRLLCTCETARALIEIDTKRARIVRALKTEQQGSHMLAVSADRQRAYAANGGSNTVTAFDFAKGAKIRDVAVGKASEGLALSPDGRRVWVGNRADRTVSVIDTRDLRVVHTLPAPGMPLRIAFTPDGQTAVVTEPEGGELAVYEAASLKEVKRIKFDQGKVQFNTPGPKPGPVAVAFSPDGKVAYCTVSPGNAVAVVDLEKGEVVNQFDAGAGPDGIAFSPVGGAT
jgi:RNA polymerase sigma factor (sigma-70 family)